MAETVSLGILSLPSVLATVGLVPGIILICVISALATYSGLLLAEFRKQYPFVQNFGDAVGLLGRSIGMGPIFNEVFGWAQTVVQIFLLGGHILMWTICMNTLTNSKVCTVAWAAIGMLVFWLFNIPRTLKYTSWMSAACEFSQPGQRWSESSICSSTADNREACISILVAVLITVIDVGIEKPIGSGSIDLFKSLGFAPAFLAVTNISSAFCKFLSTLPKMHPGNVTESLTHVPQRAMPSSSASSPSSKTPTTGQRRWHSCKSQTPPST